MIQNVFLCDLNATKDPHLTYVELVSLTDEDSTAIKAKFSLAFFRIARFEFRFYRSEMYKLCDVFESPNETRCYNGVKVDVLLGITLQWCTGSSCRQNS